MEFSLHVLQASNVPRGEAMEELLAVQAAEEPCRDALQGCPGTLGLPAAPGFPSSGCQGEMMHSWPRWYFPNRL